MQKHKRKSTASGGKQYFKCLMGVLFELGRLDFRQLWGKQRRWRKCHHAVPSDTALLQLYPTRESALEESQRHIQCFVHARDIG